MCRDDLNRYMRLQEAAALEEAVRVVRRRKVNPEGMSRAAFCRVLLIEADIARAEAKRDDEGGSRGLNLLRTPLEITIEDDAGEKHATD
jgi:hypothetical protein